MPVAKLYGVQLFFFRVINAQIKRPRIVEALVQIVNCCGCSEISLYGVQADF